MTLPGPVSIEFTFYTTLAECNNVLTNSALSKIKKNK